MPFKYNPFTGSLDVVTAAVASPLGVTAGGTGTATQFTAGSIVFAGASGVYSQDNAKLFWDDTNNRLGIGTASPGNTLEVAGVINSNSSSQIMLDTSSITPTLLVKAGVGATNPIIEFRDSSNVNAGSIIGSIGNALFIDAPSLRPIVFRPGSAESVRLLANGNVGIGTSTPGAQLQVNGAASGITSIFRANATTPGNITEWQNSSGIYLFNINSSGNIDRVGGLANRIQGNTLGVYFPDGLLFTTLTSAYGVADIGAISTTYPILVRSLTTTAVPFAVKAFASQSSNLTEWQDSAGTVLAVVDVGGGAVFNETGLATADVRMEGDTVSNLFFLDASADSIGIGTSTPLGKLTVSGAGGLVIEQTSNGASQLFFRNHLASSPWQAYLATNDLRFYDTADRFTLKYGGNVGIGTNNPSVLLHVYGSTNGSVSSWLENVSAGASAEARFRVVADSANLDLVSQSIALGQLVQLQGNNNAGMFINQVANQFLAFQTNNTERMRILAAGNVGIGTSFPDTLVEAQETKTITGAVTDGYAAAVTLDPGYTAATAQTVTRHNYLDAQNVSVAGAGPAAVTDACLVRFDAAAGTHKAVASGTTKASPGTVDAWVKININGTIYYVPSYTSTTS